MTSSMLSGERRWTSARRGGMTVLGKVAAPKVSVPKPINLPSQKLENHGLDPNVEIVPKGTLSWGSRSSASTSNAWGSSTLSPNADGGTGSPSHLSGRPSSGGSGTRPSTGSSEKAHEPIVSAWSSNSRPSSASGVLTSNQTSATSLRPRSAETRPGSSQLSRFAEPLLENSVPWGMAGTAEKLGVTSTKNDGFSLTSGDFPTLRLEKENAGRNTESQDLGSHGQPGSSTGVAPVKDRTGTSVAGDVLVNANVKSGTANSWRRENNPYGEDEVRPPSVEKWQADPQGPQPYPNTGIPHQHYEAWHGPHGPPINNHPGGVWYRGPPGGSPFGPPIPPGGFPMEPFHFYRPQIPGTALANPQPVPPLGARPRAHHPKNGDMYRPPMPDAYMRPGMPIRPGFYPAPVVYEGYYGPPMGYRNSNERDIPFMGVAGGPPVYNRYSGQNAHDPGNSHGRSTACGPNGKALASEQVEPGHPHDARGPYRVLLKQQDGWDGKDEEQKREDSLVSNASHVEKGDQPKVSSWENDRSGDYRKDEQMGLKRKAFGEEGLRSQITSFCSQVECAGSKPSDPEGGSSFVPVKVKSAGSKGNVKVVDDISAKKVEHAAITSPEIPAASKNFTLIQKIEGLNAKARASDGRRDLMSVSSREEQKNISQVVNADSDEAATGSAYMGKNHVTGINNHAAYEGSVAAGDKSFKSTTASATVISRRSTHGTHGRADHHGKGKFSTQEVDGWRKKSPVADSPSVMSVAHSESSNIQMQDHPAEEVTEKSGLYPQGKGGGESVPPMSEPGDNQAQRAKMRELAKQRVKQRQEEEEERARDQKAKALAKLEELNRRTQAADGLTQKLAFLPSVAVQNKQEDYQSMTESIVVASKPGTSSLALVSNSNDVTQISETATTKVEKATLLSSEQPLERHKSAHKESVEMHKHNESMSMKQDVNDADVHCNNTSQVYDAGASKQKHLSYKQKQNIQSEKNSTEKFISTSTTELLKGDTDLMVNAAASLEVVASEIAPSSESSLSVNSNAMSETSIQQRRRNNRGGKKHKVEEATSGATLPAVGSTVTNVMNSTSGEGGKTKASELELDPGSVQPTTDSKDANQSSKLRLSSPSEENHVRANNQWKSQHSRRMPRNVQTNKTAEKFHTSEAVIWAPVRTQNKAEVTGEASQKPVVEPSSVKNDNQVQNISRNKRAEMERYIPKPAAKEMAQQGSGKLLVAPSVEKNMSDKIDGKADTGSQCVESSQPSGFGSGKKVVAMESKNGDRDRDSRQNKQGKMHRSWRQRASSESTGVREADSSNASRNVQKSIEHHHQTQKPDVSSVKELPKYSDEWSSDGWNMLPENLDSAVPPDVPVVVKEQGVTARGKRHQFKGHKGTGNNHDHDHKKINSGDTDKIYAVPEMSQTDLHVSSKENRVMGHWQPKPQAFSASSNQQASRPSGGQSVGAEISRSNKKDSTPYGGLPILPQPDKETSGRMSQLRHGHSTSQTSKVEEPSNVNVGYRESKRERKIASVRGRPDSPTQGPGSLVETTPPSNLDIRHGQHVSSGFRRNGNQNSRFSRGGHESRGDWSSSGQENKQYNQPMNRERQRHNSHCEYLQVGPYNDNRANNFEGQKDALNNAGGKYRERGQNHSRGGGGNYHGRPSGTLRADGVCD